MSDALLTLPMLALHPLWVAWQTQDRKTSDGSLKPTKVPFAPAMPDRKAEADDPSTWGTRPEAEICAQALLKPYGLGGVGIEFAEIDKGRSLMGFDLDTCRNQETGALESWAEDIVAGLDSYAEVSPSGTGVKGFATFDTDAIAYLRTHMGGAKWGKKFSGGSSTDHPPGIEIYFGRRFFAVTDVILDGISPTLRHITASDIVKMLGQAATVFGTAKGPRGSAPSGSGDRSRSAEAFRVGTRLVADGATRDEMCEALSQNPKTSDWMREKGAVNNMREAHRIFKKAGATGSTIQLTPGDIHHNATAGETAIILAKQPIFQRGNRLVRPEVRKVTSFGGQSAQSASLHEINAHAMIDTLCGCAIWQRYDSRTDKWQRTNPPRQVAEIILSRAGMSRFPSIAGVLTCPTLRPDGSILSAPGYDKSTGLYQVADSSIKLADAVHQPTRASAEEALHELRGLLVEFPFADNPGASKPGVSETVALSGCITPVVRGALSVCPLHVYRSHTAGTGKTYLVVIHSAISTGRPCPVASAGSDEAETEKRLTGLLLGGSPIICLDNVNGELGGDLLCQAIERPLIQVRPLGSSTMVEIETRATLFANGNGLRLRGDMVRRGLICDLDAGMERPELRQFKSDPVAAILKDRGRYVSACLIIVRAYLLAGAPNVLAPIASFSEWSSLVRSALVWLGCADPCESMEVAREDDPDLSELREFMSAWLTCIPIGEKRTAKDLADTAEARAVVAPGGLVPKHPEWSDCLTRLAGVHGTIDTKKLGAWLAKKQGRIVDGIRLQKAGLAHGGSAKWTLVKA